MSELKLCRDAFEYFFSDEGASPRAIERSEDGGYILSSAASAWNVWQACWYVRTQPEATKPAPIPGLPFADLATPIKEFEARKAAALASPADALVAGDSEPTDTEMLDFVTREKVTIYLETERRKVPLTDGSFNYRYENLPIGWTLGVTSDTFETPRAAIRAAIQAQKDGHG